MTFIEKLDAHLIEKNYTKMDFSKYSGIPYTTICGWYSRNLDHFRKETIDRLLAYFRCSYEELFFSDNLLFDGYLTEFDKEVLSLTRNVHDEKEQNKLLGKLEILVEAK